MKIIIKRLIQEFQEWEIPVPVDRLIEIPEFPQEIKKARVFVGMRRTGKTWLMYQQMHHLLKQGWKREQFLYLNFEDDRLVQFTSSDFQSILDAYFDLYPAFAQESKLCFFFDEIHIIPGWEKFVRRLIDQEKMQLFITGSSAKMLSKEISTTLRGRAWSQEVFPCSFREFALFKGVEANSKLTSKTSSLLRNLAQTYLIYGGFPEAIFLPHDLHSALLQDYMNTVVYRDVLERYEIKNAHLVKVFLLHCLKQLAAPLSVTKVYNSLKSQGLTVGKNSLFEYLSYLEDAYALFTVPLFHFSENVRRINPKKLYSIDPGVITAYSIKKTFEKSSQLENAVFIGLRRQYKDIYYYKTKSQKEVDFIVTTPTGDYQLFQVCLEMSDEDTRKRELSALVEAGKEMGLIEGYVITEDQEELIEMDQFTAHCIPFWKWAYVGVA